MQKKLKKTPDFKNEIQEFEFWSSHDVTDYFDTSKAERVIFPNLKLTTNSISLRLPEWLLASLKQMANKRDVPYQSLMKMFLVERVEKELGRVG
ncbi:MAG: BrnA antitoxin family protein [Candidatus Gottesmanbacteria bacterium]|nr:BrnA antitoxin family protein [Candidatus Gottesmanbacteria bacterium]